MCESCDDKENSVKNHPLMVTTRSFMSKCMEFVLRSPHRKSKCHEITEEMSTKETEIKFMTLNTDYLGKWFPSMKLALKSVINNYPILFNFVFGDYDKVQLNENEKKEKPYLAPEKFNSVVSNPTMSLSSYVVSDILDIVCQKVALPAIDFKKRQLVDNFIHVIKKSIKNKEYWDAAVYGLMNFRKFPFIDCCDDVRKEIEVERVMAYLKPFLQTFWKFRNKNLKKEKYHYRIKF